MEERKAVGCSCCCRDRYNVKRTEGHEEVGERHLRGDGRVGEHKGRDEPPPVALALRQHHLRMRCVRGMELGRVGLSQVCVRPGGGGIRQRNRQTHISDHPPRTL